MAQAPDAAPTTAGQKVVEELKVSAHLMTLDAGVFCVFHAPGSQMIDPATGLPGVRVSLPPEISTSDVSIRTFREDGWIGADEGAALVRVPSGQAKILITIYQRPGATEPAPKIQIQQLSEGADAVAAKRAAAGGTPGLSPAALGNAEVAAHVQRRGDLVTSLGEWMGERGSQRWIEGFSLAPQDGIRKEDIEYQAVLGRGWLSPWADGGQYCGSRGMALPILGLRVRLKGDATRTHGVRVSATFTDGSSIGPVDGSRSCEAESLAPLEAFLVEIVPASEAAGAEVGAGVAPAARPTRAAPAGAPKPVTPALRAPAPLAPAKPAARPLGKPKPLGGSKR